MLMRELAFSIPYGLLLELKVKINFLVRMNIPGGEMLIF